MDLARRLAVSIVAEPSSPATAAGPGAGFATAGPPDGFYRYPSIGGGTIVFASEGDLWKVPVGRRCRPAPHRPRGRGALPAHLPGREARSPSPRSTRATTTST